MLGGFPIGRIFGVQININWSWIFIFLLVTFDLALGVFPALHPEWNSFLAWTVGVAASILFFASVLAHEIAHSLVARAKGLPVKQITLFIFGGVSDIEREPTKPGTEFLMALVGPLTSIVLGIVFLFLGVVFGGDWSGILTDPTGVLSGLSPLATLLLWLGPINILLGIFNLIPGFPLDGGRVLRSILWAATGNLRRATRWASLVGQGFGWFLVIVGIFMVLGVNVPFFGSGLIGGLWLVFIGWFLTSLASGGYRQVIIEDVLKGIKVAAIMRTRFPTVSPEISVGELVYEHIMGTEDRAFPVVKDSRFLGVVTLDDVRKAPRQKWSSIKVGEIMTPEDELEIAGPQDEAAEALRKITVRDVNQLPVLEKGELKGIVSRRDILLWLKTHSEQEIPE